MAAEQIDVGKELVAIKKLLILALANAGMKQGRIATALGIDRTGVGRMFPKGTFSEIKAKGGADEEG